MQGSAHKLLQRLYLVYAFLAFMVTFLFVLPGFALTIWVRPWQKYMAEVNRVWCLLFFPMVGMWPRVIGKIEASGPDGVILCANHASYFDIPVLTCTMRRYHTFVGKSSLGQIPVFGFMYRNLHLLVDRKDSRDRRKILIRSARALKEGRSVVLFPEGKINHKIAPMLGSFYDGAFHLAIKTKTPIVPVSIPHNHYILPDDGTFRARWRNPMVIFHPAIETKDMSEGDVQALKKAVHDAILQGVMAYGNTKQPLA